MPDSVPIQGARHRVRVFVDFWNYTLSMRDADEAFRTDWSRLGPVLARAAATVVDPAATGAALAAERVAGASRSRHPGQARSRRM